MTLRLTCPNDQAPLRRTQDRLECEHDHSFPIVAGIPVLLPTARPVEHISAIRALDQEERRADLSLDDGRTPPATEIHPAVREMQGATSGNMFHAARYRLDSYPIPDLRLEPREQGERLLDLGCGWGRWSVAAARKGFRVVGVDHNFARLVLAKRVCRQLGVSAEFVCCDLRSLPFEADLFDVVFSYSVVQHFSKSDALTILEGAARVLRGDGTALVQMAHTVGIRSLYHRIRLAGREMQPGDVRYWSARELLDAFNRTIGPSRLSIDGFFGLGLQASNAHNFLPHHRLIVRISEMLRHLPALRAVADSLYVHSRRAGPAEHRPES